MWQCPGSCKLRSVHESRGRRRAPSAVVWLLASSLLLFAAGVRAQATVQSAAGDDPTDTAQRKIFRSTGFADNRYFAFYYTGSDLVW